jgi:DNA-binding MarR family transcriptional regulator
MAIKTNDAVRLSFLVHDVARLQRVVHDRMLKPAGLTRSQWGVLGFLASRDGMTQTALAADLDLTKPAIGGLLERMETAGLIQRRPDEFDARTRRVYLTRAGHRVLQQIQREVDRLGPTAMDPGTVRDVTTTANALREMKKVLIGMIGREASELSDEPEVYTPKRSRAK